MDTNKKYNAKQIKEIGERVRYLRKLMKITQKELGKKIMVHHDVIQRIESGKLKDVDEGKLLSMAQPLNCNPDYLLLKSDNHLNPLTKHSWYLSTPREHVVESFIHERPTLLNDIYYMIGYMHPDFQNQIIDTIHTYVQLHQAAIHFPSTSQEIACELRPSDINNEANIAFLYSDENFFDK